MEKHVTTYKTINEPNKLVLILMYQRLKYTLEI
jgi:hypothetical protein